MPGLGMGLAGRSLDFAAQRAGGETPYADRIKSLFGSALIAYWPLQDTSGSVAVDISGNGRNGIYTGVDLANMVGPKGGMVPLFSGPDCVNLYGASLAAAFNKDEGGLMVWAKVANAGVWTDGAERDIAVFKVDTSNYVTIYKPTTANQLRAYYVAGGVAKGINIGSLSHTTWMHIAISWSKSADRVLVWLNNTQVANPTGLGTWVGALGSTTTLLGSNWVTDPSGAPWFGGIGDCILRNAPLTAGDVDFAYRMGPSPI